MYRRSRTSRRYEYFSFLSTPLPSEPSVSSCLESFAGEQKGGGGGGGGGGGQTRQDSVHVRPSVRPSVRGWRCTVVGISVVGCFLSQSHIVEVVATDGRTEQQSILKVEKIAAPRWLFSAVSPHSLSLSLSLSGSPSSTSASLARSLARIW